MSDQATSTFEKNLRGRLVRPTDADYDAVRALYNGMIDKRPAADRAVCRRGRRHHGGELRAKRGPAPRHPWRWPQRSRPRQLRRRPRHRSLDDERRSRRCRQADRPRGARMHVRRCRSCDARVRAGGAVRYRLDDRRRRTHARRRHGLSHPPSRPDDRQPSRSRRRAGRRKLRHGQQVTASRFVLGPSRRRRQFRRRHELPVPGAPGEHGLCGSRSSGRPPTRNPSCAPIATSCRAHPRTSASLSDSRRFRRWIRSRRTTGASARAPIIGAYNGSAADGERAMAPLLKSLPPPIFNWMGAMPFPAMQRAVRPVLPQGAAVVLEGRLRERRCRTRRSRLTSRRPGRRPSDLCLMHLYPIDGAVHRVAKRCDGVECARREMVDGDRRNRSRSEEGGCAEDVGPRAIGRPCTRSTSPAPT